ncbi:MAG: hypothetical protein MMC33_004569 [Icmadophila ericetorum]|nr:hypothetical protein [Icmadophila ericetorum]
MASYNEEFAFGHSKKEGFSDHSEAEMTNLSQTKTEFTKAAIGSPATSVTMDHEHGEHPAALAGAIAILPVNTVPLTIESLSLHNEAAIQSAEDGLEGGGNAQNGLQVDHLEQLRATLSSLDIELPEDLLRNAVFDRYTAAEEVLPFERFLVSSIETMEEGGAGLEGFSGAHHMYPIELDEKDLGPWAFEATTLR